MTNDLTAEPAPFMVEPAILPAIPPAAEVMPIAAEPATEPVPELTPPGISHEATSGTKRMNIGTHEHPHGIHTVGAYSLQSQCADLFPGVYRAMKQMVVCHQILLQVIKKDEV